MLREAHDNTMPEERAKRVKAGADHGQQREGVEGIIPQEARPLVLEDDLSQGPQELGSDEEPRVREAARGGTQEYERPED